VTIWSVDVWTSMAAGRVTYTHSQHNTALYNVTVVYVYNQ